MNKIIHIFELFLIELNQDNCEYFVSFEVHLKVLTSSNIDINKAKYTT